jgi:hypothetical protein
MTRPHSDTAPGQMESARRRPQAPERPVRPQECVLRGDELRVAARALASAHHALERMPSRLRPNGETATIRRLLQRLLGDDWHPLRDAVRFRVK